MKPAANVIYFSSSQMKRPNKPFHPSLIFASKANSAQGEHNSGAPLKGKLLALPANVRLGRKGLPGTNDVAYFDSSSVTKNFNNNDTSCQCHLFLFVTNEEAK
jgi:hypothetical protein